MSKRCTKCGYTKPLDHFRRKLESSDGRAASCKKCNAIADAAYRKRHPMQITESQRRYRATERYRALRAVHRRRYKKNNRKKERCRLATSRAVRCGDLLRPDACDMCGAACHPQAHHKDYNDPLTVDWLCAVCHRIAEGRAATARAFIPHSDVRTPISEPDTQEET